ncbi:MAG: hypothetical protein PUB20_06680 [Clostridia bacterium]|nr:hypothetical protein [Clostridia bacterium]
MKKAAVFIVAFCLVFTLASCSREEAVFSVDNSDKSSFIDFYTIENEVCIECELNVYSSEDGANVRIYAIDSEDVEIGLLKNEKLTGKTADGNDVFTLKKGENTITVIFTGEYAGIYQISERRLPRFIYITEA